MNLFTKHKEGLQRRENKLNLLNKGWKEKGMIKSLGLKYTPIYM